MTVLNSVGHLVGAFWEMGTQTFFIRMVFSLFLTCVTCVIFLAIGQFALRHHNTAAHDATHTPISSEKYAIPSNPSKPPRTSHSAISSGHSPKSTTRSAATTLRILWNFPYGLAPNQITVSGERMRCSFFKTMTGMATDYEIVDATAQRRTDGATIQIGMSMESELNTGLNCGNFCAQSHFIWFHKNRYDMFLSYHLDRRYDIDVIPSPLACVDKKPKIFMAISNCEFSRMALIRRLVPEHLVEYCGRCAYGVRADCDVPELDRNLALSVVRPYRFYIALENSLCENYHTEKIYRAFLSNTVPILWNVSQYAGKLELKSGQYFDLSDPTTTKDKLERFVTQLHTCDDQAFTRDKIAILTNAQSVCRYVEKLYTANNASSQTATCLDDCRTKWGCRHYPK